MKLLGYNIKVQRDKTTNKGTPVRYNRSGSYSLYDYNQLPTQWVNFFKGGVLSVEQVESNPILAAVFKLLADAESDAIWKIKDLNTGEFVTDEQIQRKQEYQKALSLYNKPNIFQSGKNFARVESKTYNAYGFLPEKALSSGIGDFNYKDVEKIDILYPQGLDLYFHNVSVLSVTSLDEYVKKIKYTDPTCNASGIIEISPRDFFMQTSSSINPQKFPYGVSPLRSLQRNLSNIVLAYETINKTLKSRGIGVILSPKSEGSEYGASFNDDGEDLQNRLKQYGTLEGQIEYLISKTPIEAQQISYRMRDLMLYEIVMNDAIAVGNAYGIPPTLLKISLQGSTFNNQEIDEKRFYQNTIIPRTVEKAQAKSDWLKFKDDGFDVVPTFDQSPMTEPEVLTTVAIFPSKDKGLDSVVSPEGLHMYKSIISVA